MPATLMQRRKFYNRFSVSQVKPWFKGRSLPQLCAVDAGTETGILVDKKLKGVLLYFPFNELGKVKKYLPEDVYYDRNTYKNPKEVLKKLKFDNWTRQELVFDIDADNIDCDHPKSRDCCAKCLGKARRCALMMKKELSKEFKKIQIVYSGRGYHVHVLDERAFTLSAKERTALTKRFLRYPIDPWVSRGNINLIRMPYTLNGLVNKKCVPLGER